MVLDKTGTITTGKPRVTRVRAARRASPKTKCSASAAAVEHWSEHPIAHAIVERAEGLRAVRHGFRAIAGTGAEAMVDGRQVFVGRGDAGTSRWMIDGVRAGDFEIADAVKPEAAGAILRLRATGIEVWMITGDNRRIAQDSGQRSRDRRPRMLWPKCCPQIKNAK